jgi:enoyl-CoA hydratase/carnithine racemase
MGNEVLYEVSGQIAVITLNRPEKRNALNAAVRQGLWDAWRRFAADDTARVAILTGTGDKAFCAGIDLAEASDTGMRAPPPDFMPDLGRNIAIAKPTIAAVRGVAYAGGWRLAQMCDLCVAGEGARFAIPEALVGRGATWAAPLVHTIPARIVLELLLTAQPITAQRAYEIGFVNRVVPDDQVLSAARAMAEAIIAGAPMFGTAAKQMVTAALGVSVEEGLRAADVAFEPVYNSEDGREGPLAFREKRKPNWQGR